MAEPRSPDGPPDGFGFNLVGFATANLGLGVALRNTASILEGIGIPFCVVDVNAGGGRSGHDHALAARLHRGPGPAPYPVNLFHMNPPELDALLRLRPAALPAQGRFNVCVPFWELPMLPPAWVRTLEGMDMVLAPSHFIQGALSAQLGSVPVRYYRQAVAELPGHAPDRARWGLPEAGTIFLCAFDLASDIHRKNPVAVVNAFEMASGTAAGARLVLKLNNSGQSQATARAASDLRKVVARHPGVIVVDQSLPYRDLLSLYASADVYVSLHRGEGLGLGLMECMLLGKPVIATDWSGNMDFTGDDNACLVGHTLVPVDPQSPYHALCEGVAQHWAEPSVEEAARWMRRLEADAGLRREIGERGRASVRRWLEEARKGEVFHGMRRLHGIRSREEAPADWTGGAASADSAAPRVLLQNREDNFLLPGGDSVVLGAFEAAFKAEGVRSEICLEPAPRLDRWETVQLINITRSTDTLRQLRNARNQGRPVVLLPLYEDLDRYLERAFKLNLAYREVVRRGDILPPEEVIAFADRCQLKTHPLDNPYCKEKGIGDRVRQAEILAGASVVLTSGRHETETLRAKFRFEAETAEIRFGVAPEFRSADGEPFRRKHGVRDFALFVGRIETRKNPWTLIEVFRGLPDKRLIMVGYFDMTQWEAPIRAQLPPNVTILDRLPREELISAFAAARLHVLPSWYELPGLVSLEAAAAGSRVVTTSWGTARDYFRDMAYYCEPDRPDTLRRAVLEAWDSAPNPVLRDYARETFDWAKAARKLREIHARLRSGSGQPAPSPVP